MKKQLLTILVTVILSTLTGVPLILATSGSEKAPTTNDAITCVIDHDRVLISTHRDMNGNDTTFSVGLTTTEEYCSELMGPSGTDTALSIQSEISSYARSLELNERTTADNNLSAEVESGQKWVEKLREWSTDAQDYYNQWPTLSDAQKDSVTREMLRRQGLTWGGLADLLTVLDKGR